MPKVSVIVPVYKVEPYIRECLDSIKNQTFTDWECLLIDDGSPDESGIICDEYAAKDCRFKVFHKPNRGVSSARNLGLDKACGEWVMFVDSDDAIAENTLEICVHHAEREHLDIVQFSFARDKRELGNVEGIDTDVLTREEYIKGREYLVCVGGNLLRADIIKDNHLLFNPDLKLAEDQLFIYQYMTYVNRVVKLGDILYWYRQNPNSATHKSKTCDIMCSAPHLTDVKEKHKEYEATINKVQLLFMIDIILNKDMSMPEMKVFYKSLKIKEASLARGMCKFLYFTAPICFPLSVFIIRKKYQ